MHTTVPKVYIIKTIVERYLRIVLFVHYSTKHRTNIKEMLIFLRDKTIHFTVSKYIHPSRESHKRSARLLSLDESWIFVRDVIHHKTIHHINYSKR